LVVKSLLFNSLLELLLHGIYVCVNVFKRKFRLIT